MDIIANLFSSIQNAQRRRHITVNTPFSKAIWDILKVLHVEGYIEGFSIVDYYSLKPTVFNNTNKYKIQITLKYVGNIPSIQSISRVSKSSKRCYVKSFNLKTLHNGLASYILFTSKGVISDRDARQLKIGGEIIAKVI